MKVPEVAGEYIELSAAEAWHLSPDQWRARTPDDQARMLAYTWLKSRLESFIHEAVEKQAKEKKDGKGRDLRAEVEAQKRALARTMGLKR